MNERPVNITYTQDNLKYLEEYEELVIRFRGLLNKSKNRCCQCFGIKRTPFFHSNAQLEVMLNKNFDGRRFKAPAQDGTELDCMFFPFNEEKVLTVSEMEEKEKIQDDEKGCKGPEGYKPAYLDYPTVIFFN